MAAFCKSYDLVVIGGGINGVGIARDAAGRGLSVLLLEQGDLAQATSSASTKLIHGGLRYLEHYEFRLVREALMEREVLLRSAPHIIQPLTFLLPHHAGLRSRWLLRTGLFLYDHLARRRRLPGSGSVDFTQHPAGKTLKPAFARGFHYADCWVDDARLVVLNALDARNRGATILTRTPFLDAARRDGAWHIRFRQAGGDTAVRASALVNAAGPWVDSVLGATAEHGPSRRTHRLRLVKGSHIVVDRRLPGRDAFIFQHGDGRIVFAIPYEGDFTLIGTTDVIHHGDPADVAIEEDEIAYLLAAVNDYFAAPVSRADVVWSYAGVRPLHDDGEKDASTVTRDYVFDLSAPQEGAPILSVYGGKLTTYRKLAEHALAQLLPRLGRPGPGWTKQAVLPGGDFDPGIGTLDAFAKQLGTRHPWMPVALAQRFARTYGTLTDQLVGAARSLDGLGQEVAPGLHEAELDYLVRHEWAGTAQDVLWRRTKLGLHLTADGAAAVEAWLMGADAPRRLGADA